MLGELRISWLFAEKSVSAGACTESIKVFLAKLAHLAVFAVRS